VSGWTYEGWRGDFYPGKLPQKKELGHMSRMVNSIEINGTFYALQKPASYQNWYQEAPAGFRYAVKAPRYITHVRRLKEVEKPLANFLASGLLALGDKLGPILWQFPPNVMLKDNRFERFLALLPHDTARATAVARGHDAKVKEPFLVEPPQMGKVRHAFEFRHKSFLNADFLAMLRAHNVAFVFADSGVNSPYSEDVTADFVYIRLHGQDERYALQGYTPEALEFWRERVKTWAAGRIPEGGPHIIAPPAPCAGRDVFCYFDSEAKETAPHHAVTLLKELGLARQDAA
jgi:uncharacterized protein YecE (DUF72 family)